MSISSSTRNGTHLRLANRRLFRPGNRLRRLELAEAVRTDVEAVVGQVVEVLACNEPDDVADLALTVVAGKSCECIHVDLLLGREFGRVVQRGALGIGEQWARPVLG